MLNPDETKKLSVNTFSPVNYLLRKHSDDLVHQKKKQELPVSQENEAKCENEDWITYNPISYLFLFSYSK